MSAPERTRCTACTPRFPSAELLARHMHYVCTTFATHLLHSVHLVTCTAYSLRCMTYEHTYSGSHHHGAGRFPLYPPPKELSFPPNSHPRASFSRTCAPSPTHQALSHKLCSVSQAPNLAAGSARCLTLYAYVCVCTPLLAPAPMLGSVAMPHHPLLAPLDGVDPMTGCQVDYRILQSNYQSMKSIKTV